MKSVLEQWELIVAKLEAHAPRGLVSGCYADHAGGVCAVTVVIPELGEIVDPYDPLPPTIRQLAELSLEADELVRRSGFDLYELQELQAVNDNDQLTLCRPPRDETDAERYERVLRYARARVREYGPCAS